MADSGGLGGMGGGGGMGSAFGQILDAFGNMTKAHNENSLGISQQLQGNSVAATSANTAAPALQQEFQQALQQKRMMAASGIPDLDAYNKQLDQHMSDAVSRAKQAGGSGDSLLAAITGAGAAQNKSQLNLDEQDAATRQGNTNDLVSALWKTGAEKDNNATIQRAIQSKLNAQSGALSNAGTENRYNAQNNKVDATTGLLSGVYNFASSAAGGGGGANTNTPPQNTNASIPVAPQVDQTQSYNDPNNIGDNTSILPADPTIGTTQQSPANMNWTSMGWNLR